MEAFEKLREHMGEFVESFQSTVAIGNGTYGLTQYFVWMLLAAILLLVVIFTFKKKQSQSLVPHGFFVNGMEFAVEYVKDDICVSTFGEDGWRKHFPFLASIFFFVAFGNVIGALPTWKPGTGSIGITAAVALVSFIYFIVMGIKAHGPWGYIKSLAPSGLAAPIALVVWVIEVFSTFLRLVTLAVRLFCNMFAGHVVMGTFAMLATFFFQPMLQQFSAAHAGMAACSILWMLLLILIYAVEMLIAVIQAYVFTLLSAVYIQLAEAEH